MKTETTAIIAGVGLLGAWLYSRREPKGAAPEIDIVDTTDLTNEEVAALEAVVDSIKQDAEAAWGDEVVSRAIVTGKVRGEDGNLGTGKATISVKSDTTGLGVSMTNNVDSGFYRIVVPIGTYTIKCTALGYIGQSMKRVLMPNETVIDFVLDVSVATTTDPYVALVARFKAEFLRVHGEEFMGSYAAAESAAINWSNGLPGYL